ncbi:MAG: hypothetical protein AB9828_02220 [Sphaerochaetaceae bacterium]
MDVLREMIPILLPIGLFTITLCLMFILRSSDRKDRKLEVMKLYGSKILGEMNQTGKRFEEKATQAEETISQKENEIAKLLSKLNMQQADIQEHSEDLEELQKVISYYHEMLGQLAAMTDKAEMRINLVKEEVVKVAQVQETIDGFMAQVAEAEERMRQEKLLLGNLMEQGENHLRAQVAASVREAERQIDVLLENSLTQTDTAFQTMVTTVQAFLRELNNRTDVLGSVVKELSNTSDTAMASLEEKLVRNKAEMADRSLVIESLAMKREELERQIEDLVAHREESRLAMEVSRTQTETAKQELTDLRQQSRSMQDAVEQQKSLVDQLDAILAEKQALLEEEERKELAWRALHDNPEAEVPSEEDPQETAFDGEPDYVAAPDADDGLEVEPEFSFDVEPEPEAEPEPEPDHMTEKKEKKIHQHYELEEGEEEISIDDDADVKK